MRLQAFFVKSLRSHDHAAFFSAQGSMTILVTFSFLSRHILYISGASSSASFLNSGGTLNCLETLCVIGAD